MTDKTVPCKHPRECGVQYHLSGSQSERNCGNRVRARDSRSSGIDSRTIGNDRSASRAAALMGVSSSSRSADFDDAYSDEIKRAWEDIRDHQHRNYRMPSGYPGMDLEYEAVGVAQSRVGASPRLHLADGRTVAGYDMGKEATITLKDGSTVTSRCHPVMEGEEHMLKSNAESSGASTLTREQFDILESAYSKCETHMSAESCGDDKELAARIIWERENAKVMYGNV